MTSRRDNKLILPAEIRVCATCSYWDGERKVDEDIKVVVVSDNCTGECILREQLFAGLTAADKIPNCLWEHLGGAPGPEDGREE